MGQVIAGRLLNKCTLIIQEEITRCQVNIRSADKILGACVTGRTSAIVILINILGCITVI